jgi:uncharacterized membrane protein
MDAQNLGFTALLALLPISELRGAIPFAVAKGMPLLQAAGFCILVNCLAGPLAYVFLNSVHKLLYRWKAYRGFFDRFVERARVKVHESVQKYGYWGLMIFVAIPLPMTGAWTGILGGWILGMEKKKTILAVSAGVFIAGCVVTAVVGLGVGALSFMTKKI